MARSRAASPSLPVGRSSLGVETTAPQIAQYAPVEVVPHWTIVRGTRGRQVPPDWPARYLDAMSRHAKQWLAAKEAGVSVTSVQRLRDADPAFAHAEDTTRREFTESLEGNLDRIAAGDDMPAVTANIVRLKKLDPVGYVERNLQITASFCTELPVEDGKLLLHAMFGAPPPPALPPPSETP